MTTALVKMQIRAKKALEAKQDRGATAVEYGLMVALIAAVIIVAVALIGTNLDKMFDKVGASLS